MTEPGKSDPISGWLWMWSNNIQKYEKKWFFLSSGTLIHCANQEETTETCEGAIGLAGAIIDFDETCKFVICQDEAAYHVKAENQVEKQRWVQALLAATNAGSDVNQTSQRQESSSRAHTKIKSKDKLSQTILANSAHYVLCEETSDIERPTASIDERKSQDEYQNGHQIQHSNLQSAEVLAAGSDVTDERIELRNSNAIGSKVMKNSYDSGQFNTLISTVKQKLKDVQTCSDFTNRDNSDMQQSVAVMQSCLENEMFQRVSEKSMESPGTAAEARQACTSYQAKFYSRKCILPYNSEYDQRIKTEQIVKSLTQAQSILSESISEEEEEAAEYFDCSEIAADVPRRGYDEVTVHVYQAVAGAPGNRTRRTRVPDRPNVSDSLWSVLKNCIGNDLSKMPLPVSFAEPLSLLQRLTEDFEYADVLDRASQCTDVATQFAYVAAFVSSSYSTTIGRSGKPFNPLLGETYECDRQGDLGWRSIAEQVSHHPPVAAIYAQGKNWEVWMDQSMKSKFKGTTLTVEPIGECHLNFKNGNRYSWHKPNTSIHNVIVGKLWVEQEGDVDIKCATSNITCKMTFVSSGWTGETFSTKGVIKDGGGKAIFDIVGKYSTQIEYRPSGSKDPGTVVWKRTEPPKDNGKFYSFTLLACQLNEMEHGVAPTDSRLRPDQRLMEDGNFDAANATKRSLEEFQRANKKETWTPCWFKRQADPDTGTEIWTYNGDYWPCKAKKDWSRCPSYIFSPPSTETKP